MRVIVYGVGAVGGAVASALAENGVPVIGIARGAQLDALRSGGLHMRSPEFDQVVRFDCVGSPADIDFAPDDMILLCMKTQHTHAALEDLRMAGVTDQPIFCAQNGVENERLALRVFPNVHGICVMLPVTHLEPGKVVTLCHPRFGMFDIGRFPNGMDADDERLVAAFAGSMIEPFPTADVMAQKYSKLIMNLGNIVQAAFGRDSGTEDITALLRTEGEEVLHANGIAFGDVGADDPRRNALMRFGQIDGFTPIGGSTAQSLARQAGSVETDYLNGEISFLGRLAGVPTPANDVFASLGARLARDGTAPGSLNPDAFREILGLTKG